MSIFSKSQLAGKRGSIIVLVLVFVVLLTFIVVAFLEEATARIKYYGLFHNRDDLRTDAYSAMEITLAVLNQYIEVEGALWGPEQGWMNPIEESDFKPAHAQSVTVSFEDESSKLPLMEMGYDDLMVLFDVLGFDLPEAQSLADGLIDWTDEDDLRRLNGFDGEDYEDLDPPYRPSNSTIQSWDEFYLINAFRETFWDEEGRPLPAWSSFKSSVSLYHKGKVNLNHANPTVMEYLYEKGIVDPQSFDYFRNGADGIAGTEDDRLYREGQGNNTLITPDSGAIGDSIELLRVKCEAVRGEAIFALEAMVTWSGSNPAAGLQEPMNPVGNDSDQVTDGNNNSAREAARQARGSSRTAPSSVAKLGYPFRFVRLTENRKF